jgi:hypothetical protein
MVNFLVGRIWELTSEERHDLEEILEREVRRRCSPSSCGASAVIEHRHQMHGSLSRSHEAGLRVRVDQFGFLNGTRAVVWETSRV